MEVVLAEDIFVLHPHVLGYECSVLPNLDDLYGVLADLLCILIGLLDDLVNLLSILDDICVHYSDICVDGGNIFINHSNTLNELSKIIVHGALHLIEVVGNIGVCQFFVLGTRLASCSLASVNSQLNSISWMIQRVLIIRLGNLWCWHSVVTVGWSVFCC